MPFLLNLRSMSDIYIMCRKPNALALLFALTSASSPFYNAKQSDQAMDSPESDKPGEGVFGNEGIIMGDSDAGEI